MPATQSSDHRIADFMPSAPPPLPGRVKIARDSNSYRAARRRAGKIGYRMNHDPRGWTVKYFETYSDQMAQAPANWIRRMAAKAAEKARGLLLDAPAIVQTISPDTQALIQHDAPSAIIAEAQQHLAPVPEVAKAKRTPRRKAPVAVVDIETAQDTGTNASAAAIAAKTRAPNTDASMEVEAPKPKRRRAPAKKPAAEG